VTFTPELDAAPRAVDVPEALTDPLERDA